MRGEIRHPRNKSLGFRPVFTLMNLNWNFESKIKYPCYLTNNFSTILIIYILHELIK